MKGKTAEGKEDARSPKCEKVERGGGGEIVTILHYVYHSKPNSLERYYDTSTTSISTTSLIRKARSRVWTESVCSICGFHDT